MPRPSLLRRRHVWLPTVWGWLVIAAVVAAAVLLGGPRLHGFLALNDPVGARLLVVEGWMTPLDLDQAVAAFRAGRYERIVTVGGPITGWPELNRHSTFAEMAADHLRKRGLADVDVIAVPAPDTEQHHTYMNAMCVREWAAKSRLPLDSVDVFSSGIHARRSRLLYAMAFGPDVRVGVVAAEPTSYDASRWWRSSAGAKSVLGEAISLAWTKCCFWPGEPGSADERAAVAPAPSTGR